MNSLRGVNTDEADLGRESVDEDLYCVSVNDTAYGISMFIGEVRLRLGFLAK